MADVLSWLRDESPALAVLAALGTALVFVLRATVERTIAAAFSVYAKELELRLTRRSAFVDRVLSARFSTATDLSTRLEKVMTNLNRQRHGKPVDEGFLQDGEIVPLTGIFEDLAIHRLVLGEDLHAVLERQAQFALRLAQAQTLEEQRQMAVEWPQLRSELRVAVDALFRVSESGF